MTIFPLRILTQFVQAATGNSMIDFGIKLWADEAPEYNPTNPVASHFTQVSSPVRVCRRA